jgi:hypothetical protein
LCGGVACQVGGAGRWLPRRFKRWVGSPNGVRSCVTLAAVADAGGAVCGGGRGDIQAICFATRWKGSNALHTEPVPSAIVVLMVGKHDVDVDADADAESLY